MFCMFFTFHYLDNPHVVYLNWDQAGVTRWSVF